MTDNRRRWRRAATTTECQPGRDSRRNADFPIIFSSPDACRACYARGCGRAKAQNSRCDRLTACRQLNHGSVIRAAIPAPTMPYRRTENVVRRLAARHAAIVAAARAAAAEGGMAAVQIVPVAARAGIAAGTVYRYFPGKTDLVAALLTEIADREIAALRSAGRARSAVGTRGRDHDLCGAGATRAPPDLCGDRRADRCRTRRGRIAFASTRRDFAAGLPQPLPAVTCRLRIRRSPARPAGLLVEALIGPFAPDALDANVTWFNRWRSWRCVRSAWPMRGRGGLWCKRRSRRRREKRRFR